MMLVGMSILLNVISALVAEVRWSTYTKSGHRRLIQRRRAMDRWILAQTTLASFGIVSGCVVLMFADSPRSVDPFVWMSGISVIVQVVLHILGPKES